MCLCDLIPRCEKCCGLNLRTSAFIVGLLQLICCFLHIPTILIFYYDVLHDNMDDESKVEESKHVLKGVAEVLLVFGQTFVMCTSVSLLIGVIKQNAQFVGPYLYYGIIYVVLFVVYVVLKASDFAPAWFTVAHCFLLIWHLIAWFTVQSYYQQLDCSWQRRQTIRVSGP